MSKFKVFVSAGHGGKDPGATANGFKEKDINLDIALACAEFLKKQDIDVLLSRTKDEDDGTNQEVAESNAFDPNLTVSIHNNAGGGRGSEVYHSIAGGTGKVLAENIIEEIKAIGQKVRNPAVKTRKNSAGKDYYGFIRMTNAPAVLVECAFVDNKEDVAVIDTHPERVIFGEAIAKGILKTLGVSYIQPVVPSDPPAAEVVDIDKIANDVIAGKYGNGAARKKALEAAGYNYKIIQNRVNELMGKNKSYLVRVTARALNIRSGPGTNYNIVGVIHSGEVYTIVDEKSGWGKLKSGAGWIALNYTERV